MFWFSWLHPAWHWSFPAKIVVTLEFIFKLRLSVCPSTAITDFTGLLHPHFFLSFTHTHLSPHASSLLHVLPLLLILVKFFLKLLLCLYLYVRLSSNLNNFCLFLILDVSVSNVGRLPSPSRSKSVLVDNEIPTRIIVIPLITIFMLVIVASRWSALLLMIDPPQLLIDITWFSLCIPQFFHKLIVPRLFLKI